MNSSPDLRYGDVIFPKSDDEIEIDQLSDEDLSDAETIDYTSNIEQRPFHPRDRLKKQTKTKK